MCNGNDMVTKDNNALINMDNEEQQPILGGKGISYYKSSSVCLFVCLFPISSEVL